MNDDKIAYDWLRFLVVAIGFPALLYTVNFMFHLDREILPSSRTTTYALFVGLWLAAMYITFPDSASSSKDEEVEFNVLYIASAPGQSKNFYHDVTINELPQIGTEIGLTEIDGNLSEVVVGKVAKVMPLTSETDGGSTHTVMIEVADTEIEKIGKLGWRNTE